MCRKVDGLAFAVFNETEREHMAIYFPTLNREANMAARSLCASLAERPCLRCYGESGMMPETNPIVEKSVQQLLRTLNLTDHNVRS